MTTTVPSVPIPVGFGLCCVSDHLNNVFARPAPVPRRLDVQCITLQPTNPGAGSQTAPGQNDTWDHSALDTIATEAIANGITQLCLCLTYWSMAWAGGSGDGHQIPRDAAFGCRDYANLHRLASKYMHDTYPALTVWWELWNEPQNGFMGPNTPALKTAYQKMLVARADAARNGNIVGRVGVLPHYSSGGDLWTGGTGAAPAVGSPYRHLDWHKSIVDFDADCFDHISFHVYSGGCPLGTSNGYDPDTNDMGQMRAYLNAHNRSDAQINSTEAGWFWRPDSTPDQADCGNGCNCNSHGSGPFPENIEVRVTTLATRITQVGARWKAKAAAYGSGMYFLYQQDTGTAGNDGYNHAGLYVFNSNRNGASTKDGSNNPTPLNAFLALLVSGADTTDPVVNIIAPTPAQIVRGTFTLAVGVTDKNDAGATGTADSALVVRVSKDGGAFNITPTYTPAGVPLGFNQKVDFDTTGAGWADGSHTLDVRADDQNGNRGTDTVTFTVDNAGGGIPTITSITPNVGPPAGGTVTVIAGSGFTTVSGASGVRVKIPGGAGANALSYTVDSDVQITATMPPVPTAVPTANPPLYLSFGAGMPTKAAILRYRNQGFAGIRCGFIWDAANPNFDGHTLSASYMAKVKDWVQYCNGLTLLPGVTPAPGQVGFGIILQHALGSTFSGRAYDEHRAYRSGFINVPQRYAECGAAVVDYFKASRGNGIIWAHEKGNEPNHFKMGGLSGIPGTQYGLAYVKLFAHFARLSRIADPDALLSIAGLGGHRVGPQDVPAWDFMEQMYNASPGAGWWGAAVPGGMLGLADFMCNHPYEYPYTPEEGEAQYQARFDATGQQDGGRGWPEMVHRTWPVLDAHGDTTTLALGTEFGAPNPAPAQGTDPPITIQRAADIAISGVKLWKTYARTGFGSMPLCIFCGEDDPGSDDGKNFGVWTEAGVAKNPYASTIKDLGTGVLVP